MITYSYTPTLKYTPVTLWDWHILNTFTKHNITTIIRKSGPFVYDVARQTMLYKTETAGYYYLPCTVRYLLSTTCHVYTL